MVDFVVVGCEDGVEVTLIASDLNTADNQHIVASARDFIELDKDDILVENYDNSSRQIPGKDKSINHKKSFRDASTGFTEEQVKAEVARCLGCGASVVDTNKCIGCGVCTTKCEFDAIRLHRELPECSTMRKSEDKVREDGVLYYRQDGEAYVLYSGTLDPENDPNGEYPAGGVFEKFSTGTLNGVGRYFVIATNRVRQSTATAKSVECIVPYPQKPVIETDLPDTGILLAEDFDLTLAPVATKEDAGKFTYQWYKKAPGETGFVAIEGGTSATLTIDGTGEENPDTGAVGDGYYYVDITNNLNLEADTITSKTCRVTHTACQPVVSVVGDLNFKLSDIVDENEYLEVSAEIPATSGENCQRVDGVDKIEYQWYRYFAGLNGNVEDDVLKADEGTYVKDADKAMEGATEPTFQPNTDGYYFCEVTNVYNGTTASKISRFFRVITA